MAIKDASHVFGWANMWNPLNGLRPLVHFARKLFGFSHVFASVSGKLNRMDVTGEKLSSARRHIWGSQEKLPNGPILNAFFFPQNALIPSWMVPLPTVPVLGEMTRAWQTCKLDTEKALATRGFEPPPFCGATVLTTTPRASKLPRMKRNIDLKMLQD